MSAAAGYALPKVIRSIRAFTNEDYKWLQDVSPAERALHRRFEELFLNGVGNKVLLYPGKDHVLFPGRFHPDDQVAFESLLRNGKRHAGNTVELAEPDQARSLADGTGSFWCTGSPVSNAVTRGLFQYVPRRVPDGVDFTRRANPTLDLPFEFVLDRGTLTQMGAVQRNEAGKRVYSWSLARKGELAFKPTSVGELKDWLLVSRLPNFYEARPAFGLYSPAIIFSGCHGAATYATRLLLEDIRRMTELYERTRNFEYWQAVFEVSDIALGSHKFSDTPRRIPQYLGEIVALEEVKLNYG